MQKRLLFYILFLLNIGYLSSQEINFRASAPQAVVKGEQFRLSYTLQNGKGSDSKFPTDIKGFEILYGPSVSESHRTHFINGKVSSESSETYTFILIANNEGTFTIPAATIKSDGKTYTSNTVTVKVLPPDQNSQRQQGNRQQGNSSPSSTAGNIGANDIFIRPIVTKTKVYEQEAFLITFRLYTVHDPRNFGKIEFPEFEGFIAEDVDMPSNVQLTMDHYNGRNYIVADLKKTVLFPQRSGKITIPSGKIEMVFSVPSGRRIQSFFGSQEIRTDITKTLVTNPVTIDVTPLPEGKPNSFGNAVGNFNMKSEISDTKVLANEAITITLTISGTGNLKLIRNPEVKLPNDFEAYDPKINNSVRITENGLSGSKTIEYLFIPRHQGNYTIPPIEFTYFDTKSKSYKTLESPGYKLEVEKDPNAGTTSAISYNNQNEVKVIQDIRFLKKGANFRYTKIDTFLIGSLSFWLWYILPIALFIITFILYRKQIRENANITLTKTRKANKVATKRLKLADSYLKANNKEKFYEEILRATWGYLSDKLIIPVANLNRENIEQELNSYGIPEELGRTFIHILDTCEFARYSPAESEDAMDRTYQETVRAISEMENAIKKRK